jgi:thiol-disulfide isomerase/thioredoxin
MSKVTVLGFFASWCGPCKKFMPEFRKAELQSPDEISWITNMAQITDDDGVEMDNPVMREFGISGFPTVKVYVEKTGTYVDYTGERTSEALIGFAKRLY